MYITIQLNIYEKPLLHYKMNHDEEDWKKQIGKFKVVQKCPRCNNLSLKYVEGKIKCSDCSFEQNIGEVK